MARIRVAIASFGLSAACLTGAPRGADPGFKFFDALDTAQVPKRISGTGLFADVVAKRPNAGVIPFSINTPLLSDGAFKIRYVIPPPDSHIVYRKDSSYTFPVGTVFAKNFLIDTVPGDSATRIYLETRLLVKIPEGRPEADPEAHWYGFSYRWARDQSDAFLVDPETGLDTVVPLAAGPGGAAREMRWTFPSRNACWRCHLQRGRHILGFLTPELNRPAATGTGNQLEALADQGVFKDRPDLSGAHRWSSLSDTSASLEARARSYLAANCSFCHSPEGYRSMGGFGSATHDFNYFRPDFPMNYLNKPAKFDWGVPGALFVYGGDPDRSVFLFRMKDRADKLKQMPPLATAAPDSHAVEVIADWVRTLPAPAGSSIAHASSGPGLPRFASGELALPAGAEPQLFTLRGRRVALTPSGPGRYRIATRAEPGLYLVRQGKRVYPVYWNGGT